MTETCPQCGNEYKRIGSHWANSSACSYPMLTPHQREVATGMLMGDGNIKIEPNNPFLRCGMITKPYLEYTDEVFGMLGTGVRLKCTAAENAKHKRDSGFRPNARVENYSDVYIWRSRCLPALQPFAEWYSSGSKVFPEDIELTPTVLKHWFCGDGSFQNSGSSHYLSIAMSNERRNKGKIERYFEEGPGVQISNWVEYSYEDRDTVICAAEFSRSDSEELWEYMGDPLPGFEYKWPEGFK